jgi:hypothetical protein
LRAAFRTIAGTIPSEGGQSGPVGGLMGSRSGFGVKSGALGGGFAHAFALEGDPVRVVYKAIEDRVGDGRIGDRVMPVIDRQLACHDRGAAVVSILDDLEDVATLL